MGQRSQPPDITEGAEQATKPRGKRGNGRRIRRRIKDAQRRREQALTEFTPMDPWRSYVLARIDAELEQLTWELKLGWIGEPGYGPPAPRWMPFPARPGSLPREVFEVRTLLRPWRIEGRPTSEVEA